VTDIGLLMRS